MGRCTYNILTGKSEHSTRREFITLLIFTQFEWVLAVQAQPAAIYSPRPILLATLFDRKYFDNFHYIPFVMSQYIKRWFYFKRALRSSLMRSYKCYLYLSERNTVAIIYQYNVHEIFLSWFTNFTRQFIVKCTIH